MVAYMLFLGVQEVPYAVYVIFEDHREGEYHPDKLHIVFSRHLHGEEECQYGNPVMAYQCDYADEAPEGYCGESAIIVEHTEDPGESSVESVARPFFYVSLIRIRAMSFPCVGFRDIYGLCAPYGWSNPGCGTRVCLFYGVRIKSDCRAYDFAQTVELTHASDRCDK